MVASLDSQDYHHPRWWLEQLINYLKKILPTAVRKIRTTTFGGCTLYVEQYSLINLLKNDSLKD